MNFFEKLTSPLYYWDRRRGNSPNLSVFHCRTVISTILSIFFLDVYQIGCFLSRKAIYLFNRFFLDKKIDFYSIGILAFVISIIITDSKRWEEAFNNTDEQNYNILSPFVVLISMGLSYVIILNLSK